MIIVERCLVDFEDGIRLYSWLIAMTGNFAKCCLSNDGPVDPETDQDPFAGGPSFWQASFHKTTRLPLALMT